MPARAVLLLVVAAFAVLAIAGSWLANRMNDMALAVGALPDRRFEQLTLIAVGTGGPYENPQRLGPCIAVGSGERIVLVDAGRGVSEALRAARIPVHQPDAVFLTSLLPENTVGLDDLATTGWLQGRDTPLRIMGPPGTRELVQGLTAAHGGARASQSRSLGLPSAGASLEALEVAPGPLPGEIGFAVRVAAIEGGPLPARAYRFELDGRAAVVSGPAWEPESVVELARGAQLLVQEALFADSVELAIEAGAEDPERLRREAALRTPLSAAGRLAERAGVDTLALVRLRPPPIFAFQAASVAGEAFRGEVLVPADGDELTP